MSFDFASLDILSPSEEGRMMTVYGPKTGQPVLLADGKTAVQIKMLGRHSAIARDMLKQIDDERAAIEGQGRSWTVENAEAANTRYLTALTRGWNFEKMDGNDFPYNPSNAEKLWSDHRWPHIKRQALAFVASDGNFSNA